MRKFAKLFLVLFAFIFPVFVFSQSSGDVVNRRQQLESQLNQIESEIKAQEAILAEKQNERASLERDVAILKAQIAKMKLDIQARTIEIEKLSAKISEKTNLIGDLSEKIEKEKQSLAEIIRQADELEKTSLPEVVLSNKKISEFFIDVETFASINKALKNSFTVLSNTKTQTEEEKRELEDAKDEQMQLKNLQIIEQKKIIARQAEEQKLIAITKGKEAEYQKVIAEKAKSAAKIRSELFTLTGSKSIPFEKALDYANRASKYTGVRAALILGIIAEESNLGENVGKGYWRVDMKAPRDTEPFLDICKRLGLDPDQMPVSKKPWYGYGGAMGPAQFIPSTWILFEKRITEATGHNPPNPWDPEDAFMAAALLMKDNGAAKQTYSAERLAALRYLAGWTNATKKAYAFYGDDVMELATKYQNQINILQNN